MKLLALYANFKKKNEGLGNVAQLLAACLPCTKHWVRSSVLSKPFKVLRAHNLGTQQMGTDRSEFQHDPGYWVDQGQPGFHDILFQKQRGRGERGGGRNNSESLIVYLNSFRFGELKKRLSSWVLAAQSWGLEFRSKFQYNVVVLPEPRELTLSSGLWEHMHTYVHICLHTHTNKIKINLKKQSKGKCSRLDRWLCDEEPVLLLRGPELSSQHPWWAVHSCLKVQLQGI